MVRLMRKLGHDRFAVAGHDRGGRVAYRMALDHPDAVAKLAVLDIVPTATAWDRADARLALGFWPWIMLAQPAPLPEQLIGAAPHAVIENAVAHWGTAPGAFPGEIMTAYISMLHDPAHLHAICEEYRAAASIDRDHDAHDIAAGRRIACPLLVLWSGRGALANWYENEGGPLTLWRQWCDDVQGGPVQGGHFFPEEHPAETASALAAFFHH
jgi:haloacetate dehalogenase